MKDALSLALSSLFHDSPSRCQQYYTLFESIQELETHRELITSQIQGNYQAVVKRRWDTLNLDTLQTKLDRCGSIPIFFHSPYYPPLLKELSDAPPVLYIRGNPGALTGDFIAIVGTRSMSDYGKRVTGEVTATLTPYFSIVSGLAKGVDTVAHTTALAKNATTIAILGTGIDQIYPVENEALARRIIETGALVSEYPPGTDGKAFRFPQRNRIISGIAKGTVVVEAMERSGALSTASHALAQNRDLFAIPGPLFSPGSAGPNQLIKQGAICVTKPSDIIEEYHRLPIRAIVSGMIEPIPPPHPSEPIANIAIQGPEEQLVYDALSVPNLTIDQLIDFTGLPMHQLLPILTLFELKGWVGVGAGKRYSRKI